MKVKELIEILSKLDQEKEIEITDPYEGGTWGIEEVKYNEHEKAYVID